ncbi:hypothetical protein FRC09_005310 [Ceratobasidium sp. 395]|nr:hypothetical protein FRC09_005310 [Ceratobasidium sp. 395]
MPAADSEDQQTARAIESLLQEAVSRRERPKVELAWFMALPKRIRRSGKLLETAQAESRVLLEHIRLDWDRAMETEFEREARLARAKGLSRDLDCLRAPDPQAWNGLGRRKKRCRTFEAVGRAFVSRQRASAPAQPPRPVQSLDPAPSSPPTRHKLSCAVQTDANPVPTRLSTPDGLRDAVRKSSLLVAIATGPATYGLNTPVSPPDRPPFALPADVVLPPPDFPSAKSTFACKRLKALARTR